MAISKSEIERIAGLARIKLTEREKEKMTEDLGQVLDYIERLNKIDTSDVEPIAQVTGLENAFRKDETKLANPEQWQKIIEQFPHKKEDYLKVKAVFGDKE